MIYLSGAGSGAGSGVAADISIVCVPNHWYFSNVGSSPGPARYNKFNINLIDNSPTAFGSVSIHKFI